MPFLERGVQRRVPQELRAVLGSSIEHPGSNYALATYRIYMKRHVVQTTLKVSGQRECPVGCLYSSLLAILGQTCGN